MTALVIVKLVFLFISILLGSAITYRTALKNNIYPMQAIVFAASATGFIYLQWLI